jgi:hypothetical protein
MMAMNNPPPPKPGIVSDGPSRLRTAKEFRQLKRDIESDVRRSHAEVWIHASFWRRLWLEVKIQREVRARLSKECPPGALHVVVAAN